jgi:hypothetical protein
VHHCVARSTDPVLPYAAGGGVFAWNDVRLIYSHVHSNRAGPGGEGGGVEVYGKLFADRSRISHNRAGYGGGSVSIYGLSLSYSTVDHNTATLYIGAGGGVATAGPTWISKSTIAYNHADFRGAGEFDSSQPTRIIESTISHNTANRGEAGIQLDGRFMPTEVLNSTIVFNAVDNPSFECSIGAGIALIGPVKVRSSIVSGNTCAGQPSNIGQEAGGNPAHVFGSDNLIGASTVPLPPDTLPLDDPRLAPLANNGGPTKTHALLSDSPAIDRGSNLSNFRYDQRGPGFPRVKGVCTDIGAFER